MKRRARGIYERRGEKLLPFPEFARRVAAHGVIALALVAGAVAAGALGYHFIAGLDWLDAFHNASMILSGMGPVDPMPNAGAKIFASIYAIFSGVTFLSIVGVLLAPIVHRAVHHFHLEIEEDETK
jgi:hypothetical protein